MRCLCVKCLIKIHETKRIREGMTLTFVREPTSTGRASGQRSKLL